MNELVGNWAASLFFRADNSSSHDGYDDSQGSDVSTRNCDSRNISDYDQGIQGEEDDLSLEGYSFHFTSGNKIKTSSKTRSRPHSHITKKYMNRQFPKKNPIISNSIECEYCIFKPATFEEIPELINTLRERKAVILNLQLIEPAHAQRCIDFMCGGAFSLDGDQKRISDSIFIFSPSNVSISVDKHPVPLG